MSRENLIDALDYPPTDNSATRVVRQGDTRDLPITDNSVDVIFTSPPYWQKRNYEHNDQIGQEDSVEEYIKALTQALEEWERVLRDTGTILLNIGDKYHRKSRTGIPWKLANAARDCGWRVRSEIIWKKPNGVPTPADDRFTNRHEYIFHLTPTGDYYFDKFGYEEIYEDTNDVWEIPHDRNDTHLAPFPEELVERGLVAACPPAVCTECGEPLRRIVEKNPTELNENRPQARRAMKIFNESDLTEKHLEAIQAAGISDAGKGKIVQNGMEDNSEEVRERAKEAKEVLEGYFREFTFPKKRTAGWKHCNCDCDTVPGLVLDPFAGSGTTLQVAEEMGLSAVGVDIDPPDDLSQFADAGFLEKTSNKK